MTSPTDEPELDLELSFYGPGSLACWYLALLCVIITWSFHPTKNFLRLSLSPDIVFFALYACLAAYHMAQQVTYFTPEEMASLNEVFNPNLEIPESQIVEKFSPPLQKKILCLKTAVGVCAIFLLLASFALIGIVLVKNDRVRPRRRRLLPWILFFSELWVFCCSCFLASRCGLGNVEAAMFLYSLICFCTLIAIYPLCGLVWLFSLCWFANLIEILIGSISNHHFETLWFALRDLSLVNPKGPPSCRMGWALGGILVSTGFLIASGWAFPALISVSIPIWFPDLGVRIGALDQILSLSTGMMAVLFTSYHAFEGEDGRRQLTRIKRRTAAFFHSDDPKSFKGSVGRLMDRIALYRRARRNRGLGTRSVRSLPLSSHDGLYSD